MYKFETIDIKFPFKIMYAFFSILFLGFAAVLSLSSVSFAQTNNQDWVTSRDTASPPNLNFYLQGNGATSGQSLQLTPGGAAGIRSLIDLNNAAYNLDPSANSVLKTLSVEQLNLTGLQNLLQIRTDNGFSTTTNYIRGTNTHLVINAQGELYLNFPGDPGTNIGKIRAGETLYVDPTTKRVGIGTINPSQPLDVNGNALIQGALTMSAGTVIDQGGGWHRSYGAAGWYNETYAGGWWMTDSSWVRAFNKPVYMQHGFDSGSPSGAGCGGALGGGATFMVCGSARINPGAGIGNIFLGTPAINNTKGLEMFAVTPSSPVPPYFAIRYHEPGVAWRNIVLNDVLGNVGIGDTNPSEKLSVVGSIILAGGTGDFKDPAMNAPGSNPQCFTNSGSMGNCGSDKRLKENIRYLEGDNSGLEIVAQLKPATFDYLDGRKNASGFIAQDALPILPGSVHMEGSGYYSMDYRDVIPYTTKAIQELKLENDRLKARIEALEKKI